MALSSGGLSNLYFGMFEPADNCWRVCVLLQLALSSLRYTVITLLVVPELPHLGKGARGRWGSRSRCSSGALGWCTLVRSATLLQKHIPSTVQRSLSLRVRIPLLTETKKKTRCQRSHEFPRITE